MADQYDNWRRRLAGEALPIHEDIIESGFWRAPVKRTKRMMAIAIWRDEQDLVQMTADEVPIPRERHHDVWTRCVKQPVSYEVYKTVVDGGRWPDEIEDEAKESAPRRGDNQPDLKAELMDQLESLRKLWSEWLESIGGTVTTQDQADKAASYAARAAEIEKQIDAAFKEEKRPWLEGGRATDKKWREAMDEAEKVKTLVKQAINVWLSAERQRLNALAKAEALPEVPQPRAGGKGMSRTVTQRVYKRAVITDLAAATAYVCQLKMVPVEFTDIVRKVCERMANAGVEVPGIELVEQEKAV